MDMKSGRITLKYAQAFFNLYRHELVEQDFWAIKNTLNFLAQNKTILSFFHSAKLAERKYFCQFFLTYFQLNKRFENLILLLQKHQRIGLLSTILREIAELFLQHKNQVFFSLVSYPALSPSQTSQVVAYLQRSTGHEILYEQLQDARLIAGLKMQSTQHLYNDTIQDRLQKIHSKLIRQN